MSILLKTSLGEQCPDLRPWRLRKKGVHCSQVIYGLYAAWETSDVSERLAKLWL